MAVQTRASSIGATNFLGLSRAKNICDSVFMLLTFLIGFAGLFAPGED